MLKISDDLTLTLEPKPAYDGHLLLVTSQEDGTLLHRYVAASDYNEDLFQDREHVASLMISHDDGKLRVNGIIGEELRITPAPEMERSSEGHVPHLLYREETSSPRSRVSDYVSIPRDDNAVRDRNTEPVVVTEMVQVSVANDDISGGNTRSSDALSAISSTVHEDYVDIPRGNTSSSGIASSTASTVHEDYVDIPVSSSPGYANESARTNGAASTGQPEIVERAYGSIMSEVHLVIDMKYLKAFGGSQDKVIKYFGAVMNAVALRYETITSLNVRIKIVGFTFNTRPSMEPYFKPFHGHKAFIGDKETLSAFNEYMQRKHAAMYAKVDVVFLVTGRDMAFVKDGAIDPSVTGLAYLGGACTKYRAGMSEDIPWSFGVVRTLAHEAAHTLGCGHDGDKPDTSLLREGPHPGAESCAWERGFLMSYVRKNNNEFKFSKCCDSQMVFLSKLRSRACLFKETSKDALQSAPKRLPGSWTPLDIICKRAFAKSGAELFYDAAHPLTGCIIKCTSKEMEVTKGNKKFVTRDTGETKSLDGSPCDSRDATKVCIRGDCVSRKEFPYNQKVIPKPAPKGAQQPQRPNGRGSRRARLY